MIKKPSYGKSSEEEKNMFDYTPVTKIGGIGSGNNAWGAGSLLSNSPRAQTPGIFTGDPVDSVSLSDDIAGLSSGETRGAANGEEMSKAALVKRIEEQMRQTEGKLREALAKGDSLTAMGLTIELNGLKNMRDMLLGLPGTPDIAPAGMGSGGSGAPASSYAPSSGGYSGGAPSAGGGSQAAPGPAPVGTITPNGSGNDAVDLARKYLGQNAIDLKGKLPNFTAAGGQTNNCADFVSSVLESTGRIKGHHINVNELEKSIQSQGYTQVPANQAQPGDIWIANDRGHTELSTGNGRTIGASEDRPGHQTVSEKAMPPGSGVYYHLSK